MHSLAPKVVKASFACEHVKHMLNMLWKPVILERRLIVVVRVALAAIFRSGAVAPMSKLHAAVALFLVAVFRV